MPMVLKPLLQLNFGFHISNGGSFMLMNINDTNGSHKEFLIGFMVLKPLSQLAAETERESTHVKTYFSSSGTFSPLLSM